MQENTALFEFDAQIAAQGYPLVCGVDEAGRGPLAGPVVAAAVILPPQEQLLERWPQLAQLNDSKKLSEKKREQLFEPICQAARSLWHRTGGLWRDRPAQHPQRHLSGDEPRGAEAGGKLFFAS